MMLKETVGKNLFVHNRKVKLGPSVPGKEWLGASGSAFFVKSPEIYFLFHDCFDFQDSIHHQKSGLL